MDQGDRSRMQAAREGRAMKALSLRQPWAFIVLHYGKHIENRKWNTTFRGPFLIHASKAMTRQEYDDARDFVDITLGWSEQGVRLTRAFEFDTLFKKHDRRGGIVGRATLLDVIPPCSATSLRQHRLALDGIVEHQVCDHPWHISDQYGFVLGDVEPLPFRPVRGELGFFEPATDPDRVEEP